MLPNLFHLGFDGDGGEHPDTTISWIHEQRLGWHHCISYSDAALSFLDDFLYSVHEQSD